MAEPNLYAGSTDADLQALLEQLSAGVTQQELNSAGIPRGTYRPGGMSGTMKRVDDAMNVGGKGLGLKHGVTPSPTMQVYHGIKAHDKKKADLKRARAYHESQETARQNYMAQRAERMAQVKQELEKRQLQSRVNAYFKSDAMKGLYDTLENQHLQNSLQQITQQFGDHLRQSSFQTAGQGLTGSSVDAERRGEINQAQNTAVIQAQGQAQQFAQGVKNQNEQQRRALVDTVQDPNPATGAAFDQQLQGISNQTAQMGQQYANQTQMSQLNQYGMNMQSQALGNLLSNYGNLYRAGQMGQAYGGSGKAF